MKKRKVYISVKLDLTMNRITNKELLMKLQGIHSIESLMDILKVKKNKAIYYVFRLRKAGYVRTKKDKDNRRIYYISFENKLGGKSFIDIINENSPVKVYSKQDYKIYGKTAKLEDALVFALKSGNLRTVLASLSLFKKIHDWSYLYHLSKPEKLNRKILALYELSRKIMKTRRISKRFMKNSLPKINEKYIYIIEKLKSDDFRDIEKKLKVYLPFNLKDLEDYR